MHHLQVQGAKIKQKWPNLQINTITQKKPEPKRQCMIIMLVDNCKCCSHLVLDTELEERLNLGIDLEVLL